VVINDSADFKKSLNLYSHGGLCMAIRIADFSIRYIYGGVWLYNGNGFQYIHYYIALKCACEAETSPYLIS
jgi:hypothetical protein